MRACQPLKNLGKRILSNMDTKGKDNEARKGSLCPRSKVECREEKVFGIKLSLGRDQILQDKLAWKPN